MNPAKQLGQLLQRDHLTFCLPIGLCWSPEPLLAIGNIVHNAGLRADVGAIANFEVAGDARLAGNDYVIAQLTTTRDPCL